MSRKKDALSVEQALEIALRSCRVTAPEICPIDDCAGRILAEDMRAAISSPPFRRSAMDGFAVRSEDLDGASEDKPVALTVRGCNDAGSPVLHHIGKGETARIMTGSRKMVQGERTQEQSFSHSQSPVIVSVRSGRTCGKERFWQGQGRHWTLPHWQQAQRQACP